MKRKIIACLFISLPLLSAAQKKDKSAAAAATSITAADMKKHLYIIASKEMEGRDTPSPGLEKAANYIEEHFKSLGLIPGNKGSYRQTYPLYRDSMIGASFKINSEELELNKDFQPQTSNYAAEMRFSEVVFAGYGISDDNKRDDYKDLKVTGKLVLIADGIPADYKSAQTGFSSPSSVFGKMNAAISKGAAAVMIIYSNYPRKSMMINNNWSLNSYKASQLPFTFTVSPAVAEKIMGEDGKNILDKLKAGSAASKTYPAEIDLSYSKLMKTNYASNVLGMLE